MSETPSNLPQQPGASDASVPSGSRSVRWLIIASVFLAAMSLLTAFPLMNIGACASWPLALAAAILSFSAFLRARRQRTEFSESATKGRPAVLLAICLVLLLGSTFLNLMALAASRTVSMGTMSAANLKAIGISTAIYAEKYGTWPPTLESLIAEKYLSAHQLLAPCDQEFRDEARQGGVARSSYLYTPPPSKAPLSARTVIAFERKAFIICEPCLFAPKERWVLFGNGQVSHLTDAEFAEAMEKDRQRRQDLGWPTSTEPATSSPSEAGTRH